MDTIFKLNLKSSVKDMYLLFWSIVLPILATIVIKVLIPEKAESYIYGIIAISVFFYSFMTTAFISLSQRKRGVYNLLHATPIPLCKYIFGVSI
jgi:ABC-2 type transport system permease protein